MPLTSEEKEIKEEGADKKAFVVTFTNGTFDQLEELKDFLKMSEKLDVIKMGISVLQRLKDQKDGKSEIHQS